MYRPLSPSRNHRSVLGAEKYWSIVASSCHSGPSMAAPPSSRNPPIVLVSKPRAAPVGCLGW
jgi:hypothetical protein